ncbi:metalloendopeptidase [Rhodotorula toruloides]|uniref:Metalloendopeptidase n=1 Tax=Rhodotorula toruloides TaxID=5286 RepID=A0A511KHX9_RHOTO|nr:metalloendopeptidase [Rhodotorula toruloides]
MAPLALQEAHKSLKTTLTRAHGPSCPYYRRPYDIPAPAALLVGLCTIAAPHAAFRTGSSGVTRLLVKLRQRAPMAQARAQARTFVASARAPARLVEGPRGFESGPNGALAGANETSGVGRAFRFFVGETGRGILRHAKASVESAERLAVMRNSSSRIPWFWRSTLPRAGPFPSRRDQWSHNPHSSSTFRLDSSTKTFCPSATSLDPSHLNESSDSRSYSRSHHHHHDQRQSQAETEFEHDHASCGGQGGGQAAPVGGCRAKGPGWGWYLAVNERRRRDPQKRAHFRQVYRSMNPDLPDPGMGLCGQWEAKRGWERRLRGRGGEWGRRWKRNGGKVSECYEEMIKERDVRLRRLRALLGRLRAGAPSHRLRRRMADSTAGGRYRPSGSRPFNYEAFRHDYWRFRHAPHRQGGHARRSGARRSSARGFELLSLEQKRRRVNMGLAFFTWRACEGPADARKSIRRDGLIQKSILGRPQPLSTAPLARPPSTNILALTAPRLASTTRSAGRPFSTSAPRHIPLPPSSLPFCLASAAATCPTELALPLLVPLVSILKSSAALNVLATITRISLTLLPLSFRGKIIHSLRERYVRDPTSLASSILGRMVLKSGNVAQLTQPTSSFWRWNALVGLPLLLATPLLLLALVALASLERTPITGRWRVVMLSPAEEAELVDSILSSADKSPFVASPPEGTSRDWVTILKRVLELPDEGVSPVTGRRRLLGGEVLDQRDWRVRWTQAVLQALEKGASAALTASAGSLSPSILAPPPTAFPLEPRPEALGQGAAGWADELVFSKTLEARHARTEHDEAGVPLRLEYDLLVIDRKDANAFSFGFGPDEVPSGQAVEPRRGVIVVYTGFIDEILGRGSTDVPVLSTPVPPAAKRLLFDFSRPASAPAQPASFDPVAANLVPKVLPTDAQTKALAVLLSHELAHLALSHTLESYASTNLLVPHLARLTTDVLRTILYPVTAILGPFINDALGGALNEGARGGLGVLGQAVNSCESRKLESEADVIALRMLATSGIDPHCALSFWEDRLSSSAHSPDSPSSSIHYPSLSQPNPLRPHSTHEHDSKSLDTLLRSHPIDEERVERIRYELRDWERWWAQIQGQQVATA